MFFSEWWQSTFVLQNIPAEWLLGIKYRFFLSLEIYHAFIKNILHVRRSLVGLWIGLQAFTIMAWVQSLVRELRSYKLCGVAKNNNNKWKFQRITLRKYFLICLPGCRKTIYTLHQYVYVEIYEQGQPNSSIWQFHWPQRDIIYKTVSRLLC